MPPATTPPTAASVADGNAGGCVGGVPEVNPLDTFGLYAPYGDVLGVEVLYPGVGDAGVPYGVYPVVLVVGVYPVVLGEYPVVLGAGVYPVVLDEYPVVPVDGVYPVVLDEYPVVLVVGVYPVVLDGVVL
jgi:hypothetical protein